MLYNICYIPYLFCLYSILWMLSNSPKYDIAPPVMPDDQLSDESLRGSDGKAGSTRGSAAGRNGNPCIGLAEHSYFLGAYIQHLCRG